MVRIYGRLIEGTGWTYAEIDAMEIADVHELLEHWAEEPPLSVVIKSYLGFKPVVRAARSRVPRKGSATRPLSQEESAVQMRALQMMQAQFGRGGR